MKKKSSRFMNWKRFIAVPVLLALVAYHFFLALYLFLIKQIRKSLLFPGG